jgi:Pentapeptide repeats (8 copies)
VIASLTYTKAIEQLGSDKVDVRIGGIYALERIARDSPRDHPTVMEVLAAFIREHSSEQPPRPAGEEPRADTPGLLAPGDIQAAVSVIGKRNAVYDQRRLVLYRADLADADLTDANFEGAYLVRVRLTGAALQRVRLQGRSSPSRTSAARVSQARISQMRTSGTRT